MGKEDGRQNNPDLERGEKDREGKRQRVRMLERRFSACNNQASCFLKTNQPIDQKNQKQKPKPHNCHRPGTQHFPLTFKTRQPVLPLRKTPAFQNLGKACYSSARKGTEIKPSVATNSLHQVLLQEVLSGRAVYFISGPVWPGGGLRQRLGEPWGSCSASPPHTAPARLSPQLLTQNPNHLAQLATRTSKPPVRSPAPLPWSPHTPLYLLKSGHAAAAEQQGWECRCAALQCQVSLQASRARTQ